MSNLSQFTNKQNMNLLWDVLLDELHINANNKSVMTNVRAVFEGNIKPFTSKSNPKSPIMELNKQKIAVNIFFIFYSIIKYRKMHWQLLRSLAGYLTTRVDIINLILPGTCKMC